VNRDHDAFATLVGIVREGGRAVSVVGGAGDSTEMGGVTVSNAGGNPGHLRGLADLVVQGKLRAPIRRTYPLADAGRALEDFTTDHTLGKLVITMA
jgi:NADPH:quinone reductase-like Zn-dependent oxidoreductase